MSTRCSVSAMSDLKADEPGEARPRRDRVAVRCPRPAAGGALVGHAPDSRHRDAATEGPSPRSPDRRGGWSTPISTATTGASPEPASSSAPDAAAATTRSPSRTAAPPREAACASVWRSPRSSPRPDWTGWATTGPVGRRLRAIVGSRRLREVLQVRTRRRPFALRVGGVDVAEIALDDTMIVVGTGQRPMQLRRVEVEVQPGLARRARSRSSSNSACPADSNRRASPSSRRACWPSGEEIPGTPDLGPTDVSAESTMGDLAFAVLRRQLAVVRAKEPGTRLGEDPEELHDMRVATRRLRAALSLFEAVLPVRAQVFREELGLAGPAARGRARPRCAAGGSGGHVARRRPRRR